MKKSKLLAGALLAMMMSATSNINAQEWHTTGNSGTTAGTNYIGTNDNQSLIFKTNGTATTNERMRINASGNVGIGVTTPNSKLHINSNAQLSLSSAGIVTIGTTTNKNLVIDNDEIQARGNGAAALLSLNSFGGNIWIGKDPLLTTTPIIHANSITGNVGIGNEANSNNRMFVNGSTENSETVLRCKVNYSNTAHSTTIITKAIAGISTVETAFGVGVYGEGTFEGVSGYATGSGNSDHHGVYGLADGSGSGKHIGIYGSATGGSENYGGYFDTKVFANAIRIGDVGNEAEAESAGYKLCVDGKIICEELKVQDSGNWPDYVFSTDYKLSTLEEVEQQIKNDKHLPGIPSACEIEENGFFIGEMQKMLMEKVEELTLYVIELKKENKQLKKVMDSFRSSK